MHRSRLVYCAQAAAASTSCPRQATIGSSSAASVPAGPQGVQGVQGIQGVQGAPAATNVEPSRYTVDFSGTFDASGTDVETSYALLPFTHTLAAQFLGSTFTPPHILPAPLLYTTHVPNTYYVDAFRLAVSATVDPDSSPVTGIQITATLALVDSVMAVITFLPVTTTITVDTTQTPVHVTFSPVVVIPPNTVVLGPGDLFTVEVDVTTPSDTLVHFLATAALELTPV